jgi:hypothetical protein
MKCSSCPVRNPTSCLGESVPRLCHLGRTRADYRRQLERLAGEVPARDGTPELVDLDAMLGAVGKCPYRGQVLAPSLQPACGCAELSECRAGRGEMQGRVTLQDCLACVAAKRV